MSFEIPRLLNIPLNHPREIPRVFLGIVFKKVSRVFWDGLDLIFPPKCLLCGEFSRDGKSICPDCLQKMRHIRRPLCPRCGLPFDGEEIDHLCKTCLKEKIYFNIARAMGLYEGSLREAILRFKYNHKTMLLKPLGDLMAKYHYDSINLSSYDLLIPIPLHKKRLKERGFNQSLILSRQIQKRYQIPIDYLSIVKIRPTPPQVNLKFKERRANVKGSFQIKDPERIKQKRILLIDDVFTSGATANECARVLIKGGAERVDVLTLARAKEGT